MSYKIGLSELQRDGDVSITQQLVDRFATAIDSGDLAPGEKLPTTPALAADAGVNHLTAARTPAPARAGERGDDWQVYGLPDRPISQADQVLEDAFRLPSEPGMISLSTGFPSPDLYPIDALSKIATDLFTRRGGEALDYLMAEGLLEL